VCILFQYKSIIEKFDRLAAHPLSGTIQTFLDRYRRVVVKLQSRRKMEQVSVIIHLYIRLLNSALYR